MPCGRGEDSESVVGGCNARLRRPLRSLTKRLKSASPRRFRNRYHGVCFFTNSRSRFLVAFMDS
jgi:hypothetical protein